MTPIAKAIAETGVSMSALGKLTGFAHTTLIRLRDRDADAKPYRGSKRQSDQRGSEKTARLLRTINLLRVMRDKNARWVSASDLNWDLSDELVAEVRCAMDGEGAAQLAKQLRTAAVHNGFAAEVEEQTRGFLGDKKFMQHFHAVVSDWRREAGRSYAL